MFAALLVLVLMLLLLLVVVLGRLRAPRRLGRLVAHQSLQRLEVAPLRRGEAQRQRRGRLRSSSRGEGIVVITAAAAAAVVVVVLFGGSLNDGCGRCGGGHVVQAVSRLQVHAQAL